MHRRLLLLSLAGLALGCPATPNPVVCTSDCDGGRDAGSQTGNDGGSTDAGCVEQWVCSAWDLSDAGTATRTCSDALGCGTTAQKPPVGPAPLPPLDLPYFQCEVQPVLERGCGQLGCHGTETGRAFRLYARGRLRHSEQVPSCTGAGTRDLAIEGTGTVQCLGASRLTPTEWRMNFDNARAFSLGVGNVVDNELLTQPQQGNARAHASVKLFMLDDPSYTKVKAWLTGAAAAAGCDAGFN